MAKFAPDNALLRSLSKTDLDRLEPQLKLIDLKTGATLYEMEDTVDWVYLPEVGLLSLITVMVSGTALETAASAGVAALVSRATSDAQPAHMEVSSAA